MAAHSADGGANGATDDQINRPERDAQRTAWLEAQGYKLVRIAARDVLAPPADMADALVRLCKGYS